MTGSRSEARAGECGEHQPGQALVRAAAVVDWVCTQKIVCKNRRRRRFGKQQRTALCSKRAAPQRHAALGASHLCSWPLLTVRALCIT